jgi:hypothetical protein
VYHFSATENKEGKRAMPRIAAALGVVAAIAISIGVNVYRYPIVQEMVAAAPQLQLAADGTGPAVACLSPATSAPEPQSERASNPAESQPPVTPAESSSAPPAAVPPSSSGGDSAASPVAAMLAPADRIALLQRTGAIAGPLPASGGAAPSASSSEAKPPTVAAAETPPQPAIAPPPTKFPLSAERVVTFGQLRTGDAMAPIGAAGVSAKAQPVSLAPPAVVSTASAHPIERLPPVDQVFAPQQDNGQPAPGDRVPAPVYPRTGI